MTGFVSLVGAGPGDPELLTVRAVDRLSAADLVLYDALVDPELLRKAPNAKWFYVGKRAGRQFADQDTIIKLMIRAARRGERVVRLKCGDPFVLGRGGEEAIALREAGIEFELVPGVSAAVAGPELAGIPVTHRGLSTGFVVISGHSDEACAPVLDSLAPEAATVVVMMGLGRRGVIAERMIARGWAATTPTAIVFNASHPDGSAWIGTLGTLADVTLDENSEAAGLIVVGAVVSLAEVIGRAGLARLAPERTGHVGS